VPRALIADTIDLIVVLQGRGNQRRVSEMARVRLLSGGTYSLEPFQLS
jgi:type IV secretion system protein VirB11